jgi:hypothetical protein
LNVKEWPTRLVVSEPEALALLSNLKALRALAPFLLCEQTLSSAAEFAKRRPSSLAYWVPKFLRAGLIEELRRERRAGAAMPVYRAVAQALVAPYHLMSVEQQTKLFDDARDRNLRRYLDGLDEAMAAEKALGLVYAASEDGLRISSDGESPRRTSTENWHELRLLDDDAVALVRELDELAAKYVERHSRRGRAYLMHTGIAREPTLRIRSAPGAP